MSIQKHARASEIMRKMQNGHYVGGGKFRGYSMENEVDRPSWDFRPREIVKKFLTNGQKQANIKA